MYAYFDSLPSQFSKQTIEEWFDAGLKLGIKQDTLEAIQKSHSSDEECFIAMFKEISIDSSSWREVLKPKSVATRTDLLIGTPYIGTPYIIPQVGSDLRILKVHVEYPATELPVYTA